MADCSTTKINANITLCEPNGGIRFGTDALLLADFARNGIKRGKCIDLGTGSGVIPLLMLASGSNADFIGLELQPEYAETARKNSEQNGFSDRFEGVCGNAENYKALFESGRVDSVITNPPYMRNDCGKSNASLPLAVARREISGGIELFCKAAGWALKSGGSFFAVYRPDRLATLICAMRNNNIEPKRLRAVTASVGSAPSLILVEGKKDGKEGLIFEKDLILYKDESHSEESEELKEIYKRF